MSLRRTVLFAAERGTRLSKLSENPPKPLIEVSGRPLIQHVPAGLASPGVTVTIVAQLDPSERREYELPRAIAALIKAGEPFTAVPVAGSWFEIGTLEAARLVFAAHRPLAG